MKKLTKYLLLVLVYLVPMDNAFAEDKAWGATIKMDKMLGDVRAIATSPMIYGDINSYIRYGCYREIEWVSIYFSERVVPQKYGIAEDGRQNITARTTWDDEVVSTDFIHDWGAKFWHFQDDVLAIKRILTKNTMVLELDLMIPRRQIYFQYSLKGASDAIQRARDTCRK